GGGRTTWAPAAPRTGVPATIITAAVIIHRRAAVRGASGSAVIGVMERSYNTAVSGPARGHGCRERARRRPGSPGEGRAPALDSRRAIPHVSPASTGRPAPAVHARRPLPARPRGGHFDSSPTEHPGSDSWPQTMTL